MLFLLCWWALRRFGVFCRWTLRRKSNFTACWDILSWNWSKSWQRLDRLRLLWFSWTPDKHLTWKTNHSFRNIYNKIVLRPKPSLLPLSARRDLDTSICQRVKLWAEGPDSPCGTGGDNSCTGSAELIYSSCERENRQTRRTSNIHTAGLCV